MHVARLCAVRDRAVDCGTGNGQAAYGLAAHFSEVVAIDPSAEQIASAFAHERVRFAIAPAEHMPVEDASVDLVTAAAAAHWFSHDVFHAEVRRVLKPGGVVAVWTYWNAHVSPAVDAVIERFRYTMVGPYWPPERAYVNSAYRDLPFPFEALPAPEMELRATWTIARFLGYLGTWSAVEQYRTTHGTDAVDLIRADLLSAWGEGERAVRWPLAMRIGRV